NQLEAVITKRIELAANGTDPQLTASQLELARKLMNPSLPVGEAVGAIRDQITRGKGPPRSDAARSRLDQLVAQLAAVEEDVSDLLERARTLTTETDAGRRNMQIDSLMFEAAERLKAHKLGRELDSLSGGALADLAPFDGEECERLRKEVLLA